MLFWWKKYLYWVAFTASLLLVLLGMKVPHPMRLHSPKPRPRAVVETSSKTCKTAGPKLGIDAVVTKKAVALAISSSFTLFRPLALSKIDLTAVRLYPARSPPPSLV